ncbi:MAG: phosphate-starvation-inducible PsiE family protein [Pseudonocardiaceae bacterium]
MAGRSEGLLARVLRGIELAEDTIHVVVAILLGVLGVALIADTMRQIVIVLSGPHNLPVIVLAVLDEALLLFIVAELLHTVAIALRHRGALNPEPFLVVGIVASIRRVLIVTGEAERSFRWNPQGIELLILMALILVMAITALVWRRSSGSLRPAKPGPGTLTNPGPGSVADFLRTAAGVLRRGDLEVLRAGAVTPATAGSLAALLETLAESTEQTLARGGSVNREPYLSAVALARSLTAAAPD